jgi:dolichol-phosphate mannosyltransferase
LRKDLLIATATYNEIENIKIFYDRIRKIFSEVPILFIDDSSTDGTLDFLKNIELNDENVFLITRPGKLGVGSAHYEIFDFAYKNLFASLITLDADLSHQPEQVTRFLGFYERFDFIIGSRAFPGSSDYVGYRRFVSKIGNFSAKLLLPTGLNEYTTSFRYFNRSALSVILENKPKQDGYSFFMSVIEVLYQNNLKLGQVPIDFKNRFKGKSKIPKMQIFKSSINLAQLVFHRINFF